MQALDPDGPGPAPLSLFFAGGFSTVAGVPTEGLAIWDGAAWSTLPNTIDTFYFGFAAFDPDGSGPLPTSLYASGRFRVGQTNRVGVARWDGAAWVPVGGHFTRSDVISSVTFTALTEFDEDGDGTSPPTLFVGGNFTHINGIPAPGLARLVNDQWVPLDVGAGALGAVSSLQVFDEDGPGPTPPALWVAGGFGVPGGTIYSLARWTGDDWIPVLFPANTTANSLRLLLSPPAPGQPQQLYMHGYFTVTTVNGNTLGTVARWSAASTSILDLGADYHNLHQESVVFFDRDGNGPAPPTLHRRFERLQGSLWRAFDSVPTGPIYAITQWDPDGLGPREPTILVGGAFTGAGVYDVGRLAILDADRWQPFDADLGGVSAASSGGLYVSSLAVAPAEPGAQPRPVYVAGSFFSIGPASANISARNIAKWGGDRWSALAEGFNSSVTKIAFFDVDADGPAPPALIAAGGFTASGPIPLNRIAEWNGVAWSPLADGFNFGFVNALAVFDENRPGAQPARLFAAGSFGASGSTPLQRIARWDGESWADVGGGLLGSTVTAMTVWDPDDDGPERASLIVAGVITAPFSNQALRLNNLGRWDGEHWSAIGAGIPGNFPAVVALATFDPDGPGPSPLLLVAAAPYDLRVFDPATGEWPSYRPSGAPGVDSFINTLASSSRAPDGRQVSTLLLGGNFDRAGGFVSSRLGAIIGCGAAPSTCPGDINADARVDMLDLNLLLNRYGIGCSGDPADFNADARVDFLDLNALLSRFGVMCS